MDIVPNQSGWYRVVLAAKLAANEVSQRAEQHARQAKADRRQAMAGRHNDPTKGVQAIMKALRSPPPVRLAFVQDGETPTASPERVDELATKAWQAIYSGNIPKAQREARAAQFVSKYADHIGQWECEPLPPFTEAMITASFSSMGVSAPGPDGWHATDLQLVSGKAALWMARLFNLIELNGVWPTQLLLSRSLFFSKTPGGRWTPSNTGS